MKTRYIFSFAAIVSFYGILACSNPAEKVAEKTAEVMIKQATGSTVDINQTEGSLTIKTGEGDYKVETQGQTWPENMPKEVPQPKTGKIISVVSSNAFEGNSWSVYYEGWTIKTIEDYEAQLKKEGYKTALFKIDEGGSVSGEKEKLTVSCFLSENTGAITVFQKK
jgi:hypothetical protein